MRSIVYLENNGVTLIERANVVDVSKEGLIIEMTATTTKIDSFLELMSAYKILEIARTGIAGLRRGTDDIFWPDFDKLGM